MRRGLALLVSVAAIPFTGQGLSAQLAPLVPKGGPPAGDVYTEHPGWKCVNINPCPGDAVPDGSPGGM